MNINEEQTEISDANTPKIVKTDDGAKDGQNVCPSCGATDISLNVKTGKLRCNYCRTEFDAQKAVGVDDDVRNLTGTIIGSGAQNIVSDAENIMTFECSSCGAEVVIDTSESTQARCHWCRNTLSINQQIPNGAVPDMVLPFAISKEDAKQEIEKFVSKRKFFAHPVFKKEFTTENVMGVYLPYMVVDVNAHAKLVGQGEKQTKSYYVGSGDNRKLYYDADLYDVSREFDAAIDDLTVESSLDKLNHNNSSKTSNVINAIMPFDTENCVKWDSNYLKGYTSEKRDTNIEELSGIVNEQAKDVVRYKTNETINEYDRGVQWNTEDFNVKGQKWIASYLPIWLYSYQEKKKNILHYVAVNARNRKTMGSVPIHYPRLIGISLIVEILGIILCILCASSDSDANYVFLLSGVIFYLAFYLKYRNSNARYKHEADTRITIDNLVTSDNFVQHRVKLSNPRIYGANNDSVNGTDINKTGTWVNKMIQNTDAGKLADSINQMVNNKK